MTSGHNIDIPKRVSLADQTATAIQKAIEEGAWVEYLPSERRLCEIFQVSRPTIRSALRLLAKNGWFEIRQGRSTQLLPAKQRTTASKAKLIAFVCHEQLEHMTATSYQLLVAMQTHLIENGFAVKILVCQVAGIRKQRAKLEAFIRQYRVSCCVLLSLSTNLKQWFVENSFPALVLGSCSPTLALPSIDIDFRSICRHAAGVFLRKGHRRIAIIIPDTQIDGDLTSEEGFKEGVEKWNLTSNDAAYATIVRHNGDAQNITSRLDMLLASPTPPTALLVIKPLYLYVVILYLLRRGLSVPHTVSLICRDQDHLFELLDPAISHYRYQRDVFVHRATRLVVRLANNGVLKPKPSLIFPDFVKGGTFAGPRGVKDSAAAK